MARLLLAPWGQTAAMARVREGCRTMDRSRAPGAFAASGQRSDEEIQDEVRNRLTWDSWVDARQVHVAVQDRVVTLTGQVDSASEKRAAGDDARATWGVRDVRNNLQVCPREEPPSGCN
jgi:osmotically-inducible protein OsmY